MNIKLWTRRSDDVPSNIIVYLYFAPLLNPDKTRRPMLGWLNLTWYSLMSRLLNGFVFLLLQQCADVKAQPKTKSETSSWHRFFALLFHFKDDFSFFFPCVISNPSTEKRDTDHIYFLMKHNIWKLVIFTLKNEKGTVKTFFNVYVNPVRLCSNYLDLEKCNIKTLLQKVLLHL